MNSVLSFGLPTKWIIIMKKITSNSSLYVAKVAKSKLCQTFFLSILALSSAAAYAAIPSNPNSETPKEDQNLARVEAVKKEIASLEKNMDRFCNHLEQIASAEMRTAAQFQCYKWLATYNEKTNLLQLLQKKPTVDNLKHDILVLEDKKNLLLSDEKNLHSFKTQFEYAALVDSINQKRHFLSFLQGPLDGNKLEREQRSLNRELESMSREDALTKESMKFRLKNADVYHELAWVNECLEFARDPSESRLEKAIADGAPRREEFGRLADLNYAVKDRGQYLKRYIHMLKDEQVKRELLQFIKWQKGTL